ncbi:MAG: septum formation initiator family protein [Alphaproteobacteria bacterium]|nr:septum formation initiator family protein [Alphaproteobacteria bacterium]
MQLLDEIKRRSKHVLGSLLGASVLFYFAYHVVNGDRGLIAWWSIKREINQAEIVLQNTTKKRKVLEKRVHLLRPESLDPDMLEERARRVLNMGREDDLVIIDYQT